VPSVARSFLRVIASAVILLAVLAACLVVVGQPSSAGAGPLTLPNPVPFSAVRYGQPPLKVLLVGDSMAGSLGVGLGELASAYDVRLANAGMPGCSASMDGNIELTYFIDKPGWPCELNRPDHLMSTWQAWVDAFRPDVVIYLARSDLVNQQIDGRWTSIGHRDFNHWFAGRLRTALGIFTSRGARVVLVTVPVSQQDTLRARPEDNPIRVARDGAILRRAATNFSASVSVYNLSTLLTPGFKYRASADNLQLRCADGVHLTSEAGMVVAADLYPRLWALAAGHRVAGGGGWALGRFPQATPRWYSKLTCG
jgi:hypothetical protein